MCPRGAGFYGSAAEAGGLAGELLAPGRGLWLFAEEQYREGIPFRKPTPDTRIGWAKAERLLDGLGRAAEALVPGQLIMGYRRRLDEPLIAYGSSAGQVCAFSRQLTLYPGSSSWPRGTR